MNVNERRDVISGESILVRRFVTSTSRGSWRKDGSSCACNQRVREETGERKVARVRGAHARIVQTRARLVKEGNTPRSVCAQTRVTVVGKKVAKQEKQEGREREKKEERTTRERVGRN